MPVRVVMEEALRRRGLKAKEVAHLVGLSETQFSLFRSGKIKGVRFSTLARICAVLECPLSDILAYEHDPADLAAPPAEDWD